MTTAVHKPIAGPLAHTQEWYDLRTFRADNERPVVFGASEAAVAAGLSKYRSPFELFFIKRGEVAAQDDDNRIAKSMGHRFEPIVLDIYEEEQGVQLERNQPFWFHPTHSFMGCTPDAIAHLLDTQWSVDAKATNFRMFDRTGEDEHKFGEPGTDQIPLDYLCQAQVQMEVMGVDRCDFPVLRDTTQMVTYTVQRNDELIAQLVAAQKELAERIINNDPPEPNFEHTGIRKFLERQFPVVPNSVTECDMVFRDKWTLLEEYKLRKKKAEERIESIQAELKILAGNAERVVVQGWDKEVVFTTVAPTIGTENHVELAKGNIGKVIRAGSVRMYARNKRKSG